MSHAYPDGCSIYFTFLGVSRERDGTKLHEAVWRDALAAALAAGGTLSHHHGVGRLRAPFLAEELGAGGVQALSALKRAWDPPASCIPALTRAPITPPTPARPTRLDIRTLPLVTYRQLSLAKPNAASTPKAAPRASSVPRWLEHGLGHGMPGLRYPYSTRRNNGLPACRTLSTGRASSSRCLAARRSDPPRSSSATKSRGRIEHAWVRAHPRHVAPARPLPFAGDRTPPLSAAEATAFDAVITALQRA